MNFEYVKILDQSSVTLMRLNFQQCNFFLLNFDIKSFRVTRSNISLEKLTIQNFERRKTHVLVIKRRMYEKFEYRRIISCDSASFSISRVFFRPFIPFVEDGG